VDFATDSFLVEYQVTNAGPGPVSFLPWKTPLDEVWEDLFLVQTENGQEVPYTGKVARRAPITDADYVTMAAGETLSATVDLTHSYMLSQDGAVTIGMKFLNATGAPTYVATNKIKMEMLSTGMQLQRFEDMMSGFSEGSGHGRKLTQSMTNCRTSPASESAVTRGRNIAIQTQIPFGVTCSQGASGSCSSTYNRWFGTSSSSRISTVQRCWNNIRSSFPNARFTCCTGCGANCGGSSLYAFVYPSDRTQTIYLCGAYFARPSEQGETMTHEQSHFTAVCGTVDHAYGTTASLNLARTNPTRAIQNADNHCFFGANR